MTTLNVKIAGNWTPVAGDITLPNPMNDWIAANTPTAWTNLPFATNWQQTVSNGCKYRKVGDIVYVQGGIQWIGGTVADGSQVICTMPVGFRSAWTRRFVGWLNNSGTSNRVTADTNGQTYIDVPLSANLSYEINLIYSTTL